MNTPEFATQRSIVDQHQAVLRCEAFTDRLGHPERAADRTARAVRGPRVRIGRGLIALGRAIGGEPHRKMPV